MATSVSASASNRSKKQDHRRGRLHGIRAFWRDFIATAFNPYRPELHYMRGPGPAWRAKHGQPALESTAPPSAGTRAGDQCAQP
ncbi:MAG TPA: hypothetical protein VFS91_11605 [Nitrobacter sp.]|nr:hypothetical protein [Nitrobacter sp.]